MNPLNKTKMDFSQSIVNLQQLFAEKDKEINRLKKELLEKEEEIRKLQPVRVKTFNDYILQVCKDGKQRTVREIFDEINMMDTKPWSSVSKTPCSSCSAACGKLFQTGKLLKTNDTPTKFFVLL